LFDEGVGVLVVGVGVQTESLLIDLPHIRTPRQQLQILFQLIQFAVLPRIVRQNGDPVLQLIDVAVRSIVHQHHVRHLPVYDPQVLRVDVLVDLYAVFAVEAMPDVLTVGVQLVEDDVCVALVAGCESNYLEPL
jgi:hypothetical protein